jgi:hypothetical protein
MSNLKDFEFVNKLYKYIYKCYLSFFYFVFFKKIKMEYIY